MNQKKNTDEDDLVDEKGGKDGVVQLQFKKKMPKL